MVQIETRAARPDEAAIGAQLVFLSAPTVFTYGFAQPAEAARELLTGLWPHPRHLFSYQWSHVATVAGRVQGLVLGYGGDRMPGAALATARLILGRLGPVQLLRAARNSYELLQVFRPVPRSDYYIAHLAVLPKAQGQGIGRRLLELAERVARQAGRTRCALDVFTENERARGLYERVGYATSHTAGSRQLVSATGYSSVQRMVKPL